MLIFKHLRCCFRTKAEHFKDSSVSLFGQKRKWFRTKTKLDFYFSDKSGGGLGQKRNFNRIWTKAEDKRKFLMKLFAVFGQICNFAAATTKKWVRGYWLWVIDANVNGNVNDNGNANSQEPTANSQSEQSRITSLTSEINDLN